MVPAQKSSTSTLTSGPPFYEPGADTWPNTMEVVSVGSVQVEEAPQGGRLVFDPCGALNLERDSLLFSSLWACA